MKPPLSFITLLAYDYRYAFEAIASYYAIADEIILGLDQDRLTWARQPFEIDLNAVRAFVGRIDTAGKIRLIEGNFHSHDHPMENDTRERNALSMQCAAGNWIVQIDADEMLLNADEFMTWMEAAGDKLAGAVIMARWVNVFKQFGDKALVITPGNEGGPIATRMAGQYVNARWTRERQVASPLNLLHFSWGRTPEELRQKLRNWGHARDFDTEAFYRRWEGLNLENYDQWRNFHPLDGPLWQGLSVWRIVRTVRRP